MSQASAQELLLLSALQECRIRLDDARTGAADYEANRDALAAARARVRALEEELARERERTEAVRIVLRALTASLGRFGLRRRDFLARIAGAGRDTPQSGPQSARHPVLLAESRHVLGREADAADDPAV
ncbi:ATP-dependent helicase [Methylobacterium sp. NEAU 140]|uniref:ATP-dependent helicase n=1 Tax=Methylobacterium sp. NEAU 140 TaxID=3064945 RepID=UPI0027374711|nr:ATP-dependent helicase [Methylobacterium sp. NEAU 140]MDP4021857.1 ATP-dependent helicase [Methylobacterium sp. NEAU 140]